jgi:uncharacterized membrane protein
MKLMQAIGKTCIWCVAIAAALLSLLAVIWVTILATAP